MFVPFVDLKTQYHSLQSEIQESINRTLNNTDFILGNAVKQFEEEFNAYLGVSCGFGVASGTDALHLSLRALDIGQGDEVITAANTYIATFLAISHTGAKPVPVDVDPETYNIDPGLIESAINSRTKAIIVVHLFGQPADMDAIMEIAHSRNLRVIEDACQAHGAHYKGRKTGTMGDFGCFSFYPSKNLGCYGDGGYIVTNDSRLGDRIDLLRNYGQRPKNVHTCLGFNSRLDTLQAGVLRAKLPHLDSWNADRARHAQQYSALFQDAGIVTPTVAPDRSHVFHLYVVRTNNREAIQEKLNALDIQSGIHYPIPPHLQEAYDFLGYGKGSFPVTEKYAQEILSLPMYPELTETMVEYVVESFKNIIQ